MEEEKRENLQTVTEKGKPLSIASLVCGIISLLTTIWLLPVALVISILGIVFACIGKKNECLNGVRTAGLVTSIVATVINGVALLLFALIVIGSMGTY